MHMCLGTAVAMQGRWVVLVAEEHCRCGVDVAGPQLLEFSTHTPLQQRMQQLTRIFSESEVCAAPFIVILGKNHLREGLCCQIIPLVCCR